MRMTAVWGCLSVMKEVGGKNWLTQKHIHTHTRPRTYRALRWFNFCNLSFGRLFRMQISTITLRAVRVEGRVFGWKNGRARVRVWLCDVAQMLILFNSNTVVVAAAAAAKQQPWSRFFFKTLNQYNLTW